MLAKLHWCSKLSHTSSSSQKHFPSTGGAQWQSSSQMGENGFGCVITVRTTTFWLLLLFFLICIYVFFYSKSANAYVRMPACLNVSPSRLRTGLRKIHGGSSALKWRQTEPWPWASVGGLSAAPTVPLSPPNLVLRFPSPKQSGLIGQCPKVCFPFTWWCWVRE